MEKLKQLVNWLPGSGLFRFLDRFQKSILILASALVFVLTVITVFMRYILKINVLGLDEVILIVIFWLYFLGAAQGSKEDSQIKADMISTVAKNQMVIAVCHLIARIVECTVICVCIKWSVDYLIKDSAVMPYTVVLSLPLILSHVAMLFGFLLMLLYHVYWLLVQIISVGDCWKGGSQP